MIDRRIDLFMGQGNARRRADAAARVQRLQSLLNEPLGPHVWNESRKCAPQVRAGDVG